MHVAWPRQVACLCPQRTNTSPALAGTALAHLQCADLFEKHFALSPQDYWSVLIVSSCPGHGDSTLLSVPLEHVCMATPRTMYGSSQSWSTCTACSLMPCASGSSR